MNERLKNHFIAIFLVFLFFIGSIFIIDHSQDSSPLIKLLMISFFYILIFALGIKLSGGIEKIRARMRVRAKVTGTKKLEILYANLLGILFVVVAGIISDQFLEKDSWVKATIRCVAFLVLLLSDRIWAFGRNLIKKDEKLS